MGNSPVLTAIIIGSIVELINFPISYLFAKINKTLAFLVPGLFIVFGLYMLYLSFSTEGLGLLIIGVYIGFAITGFIGSMITSLLVFFNFKKQEKNKAEIQE
ncbi:MAG: hypothetical protein WC006_05735 [Bacilli bacterium]